MASTGPGRYVQFRADLETVVPGARARLDSVAFEYSRPIMARSVRGEISPRTEIDLGVLERFTYLLTPRIGAADLGFDTIELETPTWTELEQVKIGGREIAADAIAVERGKTRLLVRLLEDRVQTEDDVVEITFGTTVLVYGTVFGGRVSASWREDLLPQLVQQSRLGDLSVLASERSLGRVLGPVRALPRVFTPNGDGINDEAVIGFQVAQVIGEAPLVVEIYDLAGKLVKTIYDRPSQSDSFEVPWNGTGMDGRLVVPGTYIIRVKLEGDAKDFAKVGLVCVAY
ncbi:FlgD immunoglobulin-like domain containing protein [Candidatus Latescibacterota bacterium]